MEQLEVLGRFNNSRKLFSPYRFGRRSKQITCSCFNFDKYKNVFVECDNINLPKSTSKISGKNLISFALEIGNCSIFALVTKNFCTHRNMISNKEIYFFAFEDLVGSLVVLIFLPRAALALGEVRTFRTCSAFFF